MSRPAPTPPMVLEHLNEARKSIRQELERHRPGRSLTRAQTINLLKRVLRNGADVSAQDWDGAAQTYLATLSLYQGQLEATGRLESLKASGTGTQAIQDSLTKLRDQLAFPQPREGAPRIESPRDFDTERIRTIQLELRRIESALQRSSR